MPVICRAVVLSGGTLTLLARVNGEDGQPISRADISTISYSINEIDPDVAGEGTPIDGHTAVGLQVADVLHDTLQLDDLWSVDAVGYNFRHTIDVLTVPAFANAGATYQVDITLLPVAGQPVIVRAVVRAV